ncbi:MAG TPA: aromatic acid decarboxylase, partial [Desulfobulbaceae bacterium]|nr:aromatic acid decarboxylase [Desulfobulbaceae bacterium]
MEERKKILLAITGATGMLYVPELLGLLEKQRVEVHGIISASGCQVLKLELGLKVENLPAVKHWFGVDDFAAPPASG